MVGWVVCRLVGCVLLAALLVQPAPAERARVNLDRGWRFLLGDDPAASAAAFDDSGWQYVHLPHSFNEPYFRSPDFYVGYGWYRKHFAMDASALKGEQFVEFDGAFQTVELWVNGQRAGGRLGGYTGFPLQLTGARAP